MHGGGYWAQEYITPKTTGEVLSSLRTLGKTLDWKYPTFRVLAMAKYNNTATSTLGIVFGKTQQQHDTYEVASPHMYDCFSVMETQSNCGMLQLSTLYYINQNQAKGFSKWFRSTFKEFMGYSCVFYTSAHAAKKDIEKDDLSNVLSIIGFVPIGDPWKNNRSGNWIQNWMWVM